MDDDDARARLDDAMDIDGGVLLSDDKLLDDGAVS